MGVKKGQQAMSNPLTQGLAESRARILLSKRNPRSLPDLPGHQDWFPR